LSSGDAVTGSDNGLALLRSSARPGRFVSFFVLAKELDLVWLSRFDRLDAEPPHERDQLGRGEDEVQEHRGSSKRGRHRRPAAKKKEKGKGLAESKCTMSLPTENRLVITATEVNARAPPVAAGGPPAVAARSRPAIVSTSDVSPELPPRRGFD